ncbi:MAG TPA: tetratricopeptide repeat protein [Bacteroidota bacterium]|nr:tetratricopeptide repeat protein [Bacteroidota bacterium]
MRDTIVPIVFVLGLLGAGALTGCSSSEKTAAAVTPPEDEQASLSFYLQGSLYDQKGDYAKAILEYQKAIRLKQDAAIYHAMAKDYAVLGDNQEAIENGEKAVQHDPANRSYHETLGQIYVNAENLDSAVAQYKEVVHVDSSYEQGWLNLGRLVQLRNPEDALKLYSEVIDRFGPNSDTYFQMAQIYDVTGKLDKATEAVEGMLSLDPGNFEIKKMLGDLFVRRDSVDTALKIYSELAERKPENLELRASIAHAYLTKQDYDHAAEQLDLILRKDTLSVDDQLRFGQIFTQFIQKDSAVVPYALKLFTRIRNEHPDDWRPYWFLGAIDNIMKDDSTALINWTKVKELQPSSPDGWVGVASVYYDRNDFDKSIAILTEAKSYVPDEFRVYFLLGISYQRKHDDISAAAVLEKAVELNGKSVDALSTLALVYDELKRPDESDSIYERALQIDPKNHLLLNNYGYSLADRGLQLDRALKMSKEAVSQEPENQSYLDTYGWIYFRMGNYTEAEKWIKKAIDLGSKSPVIHEHLGDVYFKLSDKDKAMEYWQKALQFDTSNEELKQKIERGSL